MNVFLYTYVSAENFDLSKELGVFGASEKQGMLYKLRQLAVGDLVIIRESGWAWPHFLGTCTILGEIVEQRRESPYPDFLWPDEAASGNIIYPYRAPADFLNSPEICRPDVPWDDLCDLGMVGAGGQRLDTPQQWGQALYGNFVGGPLQKKAILALLDIDLGPFEGRLT